MLGHAIGVWISWDKVLRQVQSCGLTSEMAQTTFENWCSLEVMEGFARSGQRRGDLRRDLPPESVARVIAGAIAAMLADGRAGDAEAGGARCEELLGILLNGLREAKPRLKWSARG